LAESEEGMKKIRIVVILSASLTGGAIAANASEDAGRSLLETRCGRCHAIDANATSSLAAAPNLWETLRSYPIEMLEIELAEGIGSRHLEMPQIQFTSEEIEAVEAYLQLR
jgi:cytochrome c